MNYVVNNSDYAKVNKINPLKRETYDNEPYLAKRKTSLGKRALAPILVGW